jgi:hypothetical protein
MENYRNKPSLRKYRWLFFGLATLGIVGTPSAIVSAVRTSADHGTVFLMTMFALAFLIRLFMIGFSLKIWWTRGSLPILTLAFNS